MLLRFQGRVKPSKETSINVLVDNLLHPNYIPVQFGYNRNSMTAEIRVNNLLEPNQISGQTNFNLDKFNAFLCYGLNTRGPDTARFGGDYNFSKDGRIGFTISGYNNNLTNIDLGIFLKALSLVYERDNIGNNSVRLSISKQF